MRLSIFSGSSLYISSYNGSFCGIAIGSGFLDDNFPFDFSASLATNRKASSLSPYIMGRNSFSRRLSYSSNALSSCPKSMLFCLMCPAGSLVFCSCKLGGSLFRVQESVWARIFLLIQVPIGSPASLAFFRAISRVSLSIPLTLHGVNAWVIHLPNINY